ncbi:hypothetical protein PPSIR1_25451 [Plesiocystis pacifica SIR-1]|uniref:THAP4-like heme-binding domain-containing protein n=1 Tax=Plesiocystis pacifica SIR-1 TaxID=391625 RepID=A6FZA4_9BACT|nr:heme-binding beta-barrel domain-containing protein [Plesiocystis pacifica]EDM80988.1 hypothetical protein PPSIR1_25451 [Plesiocystis pacifica SIR-1]
MTDENITKLGPLAALVGTWEGGSGADVAPDDRAETDRETRNSKYRERLVLEPIGRVDNHEQVLYGLEYFTMAWREGAPEDQPFHQENGYWLWDAANNQVLRCFIVPRGLTVLAGGTVEPDAKEWSIAADAGSETYGICSNKFLIEEFKTVRYELKITVHEDGSFSYFEDTQLAMKGREELFHHTDQNHLRRVSP